jgi:peptidoglycan/LPS O-acetylase OafA/YrhL
MKYRKEIDGLRAIAVLPVILFHAGFDLFGGGFVGVDIFFVISGYLITSILIDDIQNNKFSFVEFYVRRIRRIFPALLLVLAFTYFISSLVALPSGHKVIGQYVAASVLGVSNILLFVKGKDYFGLEEGGNPLFITWSLGVEEQFYFAFPLIALMAWRFGRNNIIYIFAGLAGVSIFLSEVFLRVNPAANFYLAPTRAWELLAGCIVAFVIWKKNIASNNILSMFGLLGVIFSIFYFHGGMPFPGLYAMLPVFGAVLIILFGGENTFVGKILSMRLFVGIGLISYSIYLWHLPLQIYLKYVLYDGINYHISYFISLFVLSCLTYRFIEIPFRRRLQKKVALSIILFISLVLLVLGVWGHLNGGYPQRSDLFNSLRSNNGWGVKCNGNTEIIDSCSNSTSPQVAVLGNSYAMTWINSIAEKGQLGVVQLTQDSCAVGFVDVVKDVNSIPCGKFYERAVETIIGSPSIDYVIISSPFDKEIGDHQFEKSFLGLIERLGGKKIFVIGPTPSAPFNVGECILKKSLFAKISDSNCDFFVDDAHHAKLKKLNEMMSGVSKIKFIDITSVICPSGLCLMSRDGIDSMYMDRGHLSYGGANFVFEEIRSELGWLLN